MFSSSKFPRKFSSATFAAAMLAVSVPPEAAEAQTISQVNWVAAKQAARLPNGVTLKYVEAGDPNGKPLVLVHGWTDTSRSWSLLLPGLSRYRLIIPDLRGHGGSDKPDCCYAVGDFAHDLKLLLDSKGIARTSVVGHSLGGVVAQRFAADHPDRVEALALVASTSGAALAHGDWLWRNVMALKAPVDQGSPFMREWVSGVTPVDTKMLDAIRPETAAVPIHVWHAVARELATTSAGNLAPDVRAPVLILWGASDPLLMRETQRNLKRHYPRAAWREFTGRGHNLHWELPGEVARAVVEFLEAKGTDGPAPAALAKADE